MCFLPDDGQGQEYMLEPTDTVQCVPDHDDPFHWHFIRSTAEASLGGPGSTVDFWKQSLYIDRLTPGVEMHSTAAFLSMPNEEGIITGGATTRGFNDGSQRGHPLWLELSTKQVRDVVCLDERDSPLQGR